MKVLLLCFALALCVFGRIQDKHGIYRDEAIIPAINDDIVEFINSQPTGWTAHHNPNFDGLTLKEVKMMLGATTGGYWHRRGVRKTYSEEEKLSLPASFDSRTQWPNCTTIGKILDQGRCGSCWAFGATEAISDRFCIESNATLVLELSEMDMTTCCDVNDGCEGGEPYSAWSWAAQAGLVESTCSPYTIPTCPPTSEPCLPNTFVPTPACNQTCSNGQNWQNDKYYVSSVYHVGGLFERTDDIAKEIVENGPVEAAFSVYEDFLTYKSGVYQHTTGGYLGGHAIKIIGFGTENGVDYWLVANSWTTTWGDQGFFKIKKGDDQCGIESGVVGGTVKIP